MPKHQAPSITITTDAASDIDAGVVLHIVQVDDAFHGCDVKIKDLLCARIVACHPSITIGVFAGIHETASESAVSAITAGGRTTEDGGQGAG